MFNTSSTPSLADIAAVTDGNRNNNDGWGNGMGGWWVLIILLALFGGFGNGGWGNNRNNGNGCENTVFVPYPAGGFGGGWGSFDAASMQRGFDTSGIIAKLDGINAGICSLGYDQLNQMNGINNTVQQTGWGISQQLQQNAIAAMQQANALSTQLSGCCCDVREGIQDLRYTMATDTCAIKNEVHQTGDSIINAINWGNRNLSDTIRDGFADLQRQNDQRYIAELERKLNNCDLDAALQGTASYIINSVNPRSNPAYIVPNPNTGCVIPTCGAPIPVQVQQGCSCNNGCCGNC